MEAVNRLPAQSIEDKHNVNERRLLGKGGADLNGSNSTALTQVLAIDQAPAFQPMLNLGQAFALRPRPAPRGTISQQKIGRADRKFATTTGNFTYAFIRRRVSCTACGEQDGAESTGVV